MQSAEATLLISAGFVGILTLFVLFTTGSLIAVLALWLVTAMIVLVLWYYGFLDLNVMKVTSIPDEKPAEDVPAPASAPASGASPRVGSEVFHIEDAQFTYADAPAVCAAYDSQLATLEQITDAYNNGAEWCSYGWSAGGFALYPTQRGTWQALMAEPDTVKRTACGRPGVNGGYFDPNTKFGVNCFGFKPKGDVDLPLPPPGTDSASFRAAVTRFRNMMSNLNLNPYSRTEWSGYDSTAAGQIANYGSQFQQAGAERENFTTGDPTVSEAPVTSNSYSAAPIGLKGDTGPAGPAGPAGPLGPAGSPGPAGTIGGVGPAGPTGPTGPQGLKGDTGKDGAYPGKVPIADTRGANDPPRTYYSKGMGKYNEFKHTNVVGLPNSLGEYSEVETTVPWGDPSGGPVIQSTPNGFWRSGSGSSWTSWMDSPGKITGLASLTPTSSREQRIEAYIKDFPGTEWLRTNGMSQQACKTNSDCSSKFCRISGPPENDDRCATSPEQQAAYGLFR
jgi:hypothetical protein